MNPFTTPNGPISSGFFIFIEGGHVLADEHLLAKFGYGVDMKLIERSEVIGLDRQQSQEFMGRDSRYVVLAETDRWKLIADDRFYTLWSRASTRVAICELAERYNILTFAQGGMDHSYDLRYFKDGDLVREWIVDDVLNGPDQGQRLLVDSGSPLAAERGLQIAGLKRYLQEVASANGFHVADALESARIWCGETYRPADGPADVAAETRRRTLSWRSD